MTNWKGAVGNADTTRKNPADETNNDCDLASATGTDAGPPDPVPPSPRRAFASVLIVLALQACGGRSSYRSGTGDGSVGTDSAAAVPDASQPDAADASSGGTGAGDLESGADLADSNNSSEAGGAGDSAGLADGGSSAVDSATGPASPLCAGKGCGDSCGNGEFPMFCNDEGMCLLVEPIICP